MVKNLSQTMLDGLCAQAADSPRQRAHHNLHESPEDAVQRLVIALQPSTFVQAHRHTQPWKWELLLPVRGVVGCLIFDDVGTVLERFDLGEQGASHGVEFPANCWHSVFCGSPDSVIIEVKPGPYDPANAAQMAGWCPAESDPQAGRFLAWMRSAAPGERFSA